jgi:hypothetical protein
MLCSIFIYYAIALSDTRVMRVLKVNLIVLLLMHNTLAFGVSKVIDGGAGTDSLTINYSGISSLGDFAITTSEDYLVLTDSSSKFDYW